MSDCFFDERNLESNSESNSNVFEYFFSQKNKNNLISTISKIQVSYGIYDSISNIQKLTDKLLIEFKPHIMFIGLSFNTLMCDYITSLEFLIREFIKINYEKIINSDSSSDLNSSFNSLSIDNNKHTKLMGTTYDIDGMTQMEVMDTQDMRPEDWQNLNVLDTSTTQVSSKNYRNNNKIPWRQKQGQVRQYDRDNIETLANVRDTESVTYKNTGLKVNRYDRKILGIMD
jgi:hypothetical protein